MREKHQSGDFCKHPDQGWKMEPATQACALTRNQTGDVSVCGMMPNQLSHTNQSPKQSVKKKEVERLILSDFKTYYEAMVIKTLVLA